MCGANQISLIYIELM